MKNKKGFLLAEETLKIVIALICISFLVYFLVSLYMSNREDKDLELAKASLQHLVSEINAEHSMVEIYNPGPLWNKGVVISSWYLVSWNSMNLPNRCSNFGWGNCLCICKENKTKNCDDKGVCLESKDIEIQGDSIELKDLPLTLTIKYNGGEILISK